MTEKRFTSNCKLGLFDGEESKIKCLLDNGEFKSVNEWISLLNELAEENYDNKAMIEFLSTENTQIMNELKTRTQIQHQLEKENEQLKQQIKDLRINVLDSIHEADEIKCTCNPCVVEECVKKVVE